MRALPILFKTDMVKAILDGRKTQTRRIVKDRHISELSCSVSTEYRYVGTPGGVHVIKRYWRGEYVESYHISCPYRIGYHLWVRETHRFLQGDGNPNDFGIEYIADKSIHWYRDNAGEMNYPIDCKTRPSIFLPRKYSRISLEITGIEIQRLNYITDEEAIAEGIEYKVMPECTYYRRYVDNFDTAFDRITAVESFRSLWDSINKKRGFGWDKNPWVWVYSFKVIKPELQEGK
jgi:hypothetical protein